MKILLVEDDASTARFLSTTLAGHQHTVDVATDGQTGLELTRYGEEEFAILLPITNLDGAVQVTQLIQQEITKLGISRHHSTVSAQVTLSIGITGTIPTQHKSIKSLITMAEQVLYAAKRRGGNTYCLYPL